MDDPHYPDPCRFGYIMEGVECYTIATADTGTLIGLARTLADRCPPASNVYDWPQIEVYVSVLMNTSQQTLWQDRWSDLDCTYPGSSAQAVVRRLPTPKPYDSLVPPFKIIRIKGMATNEFCNFIKNYQSLAGDVYFKEHILSTNVTTVDGRGDSAGVSESYTWEQRKYVWTRDDSRVTPLTEEEKLLSHGRRVKDLYNADGSHKAPYGELDSD